MVEREVEIFPGRVVKFYDSPKKNFLLPELSGIDLKKNFPEDLFAGFQSAKENSDPYVGGIYSSFCFPLKFSLGNPESMGRCLWFNRKKMDVFPLALETEFFGWRRNRWVNKETGKELYDRHVAGMFDIMGVGKVGGEWIMSTQEHHSVPFNVGFI